MLALGDVRREDGEMTGGTLSARAARPVFIGEISRFPRRHS
jgi:hypothetical protein